MLRTFVQGISPVLPVLIILILVLLSIFIAWWSYRDLSSLTTSKKWSLIALRAVTLIILSLLLLNPYLIRDFTNQTIPEIAIYLDNSSSMAVVRGDYRGEEGVLSRIEEFNQNRPDEFLYPVYLIGDNVREEGNPDFTDGSTNFQQMIEHLLENENRYRAAILFSDGIITRGRNPVFSAQNLSLPLITIPIGDSTTVQDISIAGIAHDDPVYTNSTSRITAEVRHRGYEGMETEIILLENGISVERKTLVFPSISGTEWIDFDRTYTESGYIDLTIEVVPFDDEFTDQNNRSSSSLQILDDKLTILSLAYEIHPDVASVRRYIATDQQYELIQSTYIGNNRYSGQPLSGLDMEEIDLLVLHGLPPGNHPDLDIWLEADIPVLFFSTPGSVLAEYSESRQNISLLTTGAGQNSIEVTLREAVPNGNHPLLEYNSVQFNRFPTLITNSRSIQPSPAAEVLLRANYQRTETDIPLLLAGDFGNRRITSVNAYGWNRLEMSMEQEISSFINEFMGNLISWTASPSDRRLLILEPLRNSFTENEPVRIRATLLNERGEPEPDASIGISITGQADDEQRSFQMNHVNEGNYELNAGRYPSGVYVVKGIASGNGRLMDEDETRFVINTMNEELINTRRNDELLRQLAAVTGGFLLDENSKSRLNEFLSDLISDRPVEESISETEYIYRYSYWFILVIVLLTSEWLLRRNVSLP